MQTSLDWTLVTDVVNYYNFNHSTVRATAKHFGISKTTVYNYLTKVMPNELSSEILHTNKSEAPYRGAQATKNKYLSMRS